MNFAIFAAICGILLAVTSIASILVSSQIFQLDWFCDVLSDLGAESAQSTNAIFNGGMIVTGLLGIGFSAGCIKNSTISLTRAGFVLIGIASASLIGLAVFNLPHVLHVPVSASFFAFAPAGVFVVGIGQLKQNKKDGIYAVIASVISAVFAIILTIGFLNATPFCLTWYVSAITESIAAFSVVAWIFYYSIGLFK